MKALIIPGNSNTAITENWFQYVKKELEGMGIEVIAENMPDPDLARKKYWIPFIKEKLSTENSILIGHSSGAVAIMRYLEENKCRLAVLWGFVIRIWEANTKKRVDIMMIRGNGRR